MDLDEDFRNFAGGTTAADFSNWKGVGENGFKSMKKVISSKERVIEPEQDGIEDTSEEDKLMSTPLPPPKPKKVNVEPPKESIPQTKQKEIDLGKVKHSKRVDVPLDKPDLSRSIADGVEEGRKNIRQEAPQPDRSQMPGVQEAILNPAELKQIAIKLLPNVEKVKPEDYAQVSEMAINFAFEFLKVWNYKVSVEG